jgi:hypothetical protein
MNKPLEIIAALADLSVLAFLTKYSWRNRVKPPPQIQDQMPAWKEVRWVMIRVILLLGILMVYLLLGGPIPNSTRGLLSSRGLSSLGSFRLVGPGESGGSSSEDTNHASTSDLATPADRREDGTGWTAGKFELIHFDPTVLSD